MTNAITQQIIAINHDKLVANVETMKATLDDCQGERTRIVLTQNLEQAQRALEAYRAKHGIEVEATPEDAVNSAMDMAQDGMVELDGLAARMLATAMDAATGGCVVSSTVAPLSAIDEGGLVKSWVTRALSSRRGELRLTITHSGKRPTSAVLMFDAVVVGRAA